MTTYYDSKGNIVYLDCNTYYAAGGEGKVCSTNRDKCVAKIFFKPTQAKADKLIFMVNNPPVDPTLDQGHVSIAWPTDLLFDGPGKIVGFLMPEIKGSQELVCVYIPVMRNDNKNRTIFNWRGLHITALNLALTVQAIHDKGYVIGDLRELNILVNDKGLISIIDTDSFQVSDSTGITYRCDVFSPEYIPPELIGKDLKRINQTIFSDNFRLAVIIYLLLFGHHPYSGKWKGEGERPEVEQCIQKNFWPYSDSNEKMALGLHNMPLDILHPNIRALFLQCFNQGHDTPTARPSASDWCIALEQAIPLLKRCKEISNHWYNSHTCYWCKRAKESGIDIIFPEDDSINR